MPSKAWADIVSQALSTGERFRSQGSVAWYRGERDASWKLKSTIHRHVERWTEGLKTPFTDQERKELLRDECKTVFREFKTEAGPLLAESEKSDWGIIFAMQHFSLPTRLLDWTESFACAVFFAQLHRNPDASASIWVLDPQGLNELAIGKAGLIFLDENASERSVIDTLRWHPKRLLTAEEELMSIAGAPIYTNPRMVQQRARFTLMGDSFLPLDEQCDGELIRRGLLQRVILPPETFNDAKEFLDSAGITAFTFFPDLQGLALKHQLRVQRDLRSAKKAFPEQFK